MKLPSEWKKMQRSSPKVVKPRTEEELAFLPVTHLSKLIESRTITSTELTRLYLSRLKKYDPTLKCVVTLTEELALKQAKQADDEIKAGKYRGPLHGIPWGAKDLFAVKGYPTTWGASPYKDQVIDMDSTVFTRLTEAGAVLVAKLTLGALAMGDRWFGGQTRSPWNPETGSSGSSAGPAATVAGGLVGFAIGTETLGSIMSPSSRCGVNGLRPTFGRVSRYGAMALSWTMDKIGPLCRSAEDCALVFDAIYGPDGKDNSVVDVPFNWDVKADVRKLRVGYLKSTFEREIRSTPDNPDQERRARESLKLDKDALEVIRSLGVNLVPIELPQMQTGAIGFILNTEGAAAFDELTRSDKIAMMTADPERSSWPSTFRLHRFVPAVEYIQANRVRMQVMEEFNKVFDSIDMFLGSSLSLTNLTGHPELNLVHGFDDRNQPASLRITGRLFGEAEMLLLAYAYQSKTDFHLKHPKME
jgi:Asp-tRNA(Asn)/Glu-tRNA(Gln) amidotransferase A subunit family amidase